MRIKPPPPWLIVTGAFYCIVIASKSETLLGSVIWPAIAAAQFFTGLDGYLKSKQQKGGAS